MVPSAFAIPAPIPLALDLTAAFGPLLLLAVLALLDLSAVAVLHAALVMNRGRRAGEEIAVEPSVIRLRRRRSEKRQAAPPSRAA